jgi:hypothetical protein
MTSSGEEVPDTRAPVPRRPALVWLILASLAVAGLGVVSAGLWIPSLMLFDAPGSAQNVPLVAFALYSASGPVAAALGLLAGWVRVAMGQRFSGLKWMIVIPVVWLVGLLGWFAVLTAFCDGQFDCRA